jgi:phosphoglycerol transferase MdoB-like AlkP superfamily enzyme
MTTFLSLVLGYIILYLVSWVLIALFIFIYSRISHKARSLSSRLVSISSLLAAIYLGIFFISLAFFSANRYVCFTATFVFAAYFFYFVLRKYKKQQLVDALILAIGISVVLNPGWLGLLRIL